MSDELKKKIKLAQTGDKETLNKLVEENFGLVKSISLILVGISLIGGYIS